MTLWKCSGSLSWRLTQIVAEMCGTNSNWMKLEPLGSLRRKKLVMALLAAEVRSILCQWFQLLRSAMSIGYEAHQSFLLTMGLLIRPNGLPWMSLSSITSSLGKCAIGARHWRLVHQGNSMPMSCSSSSPKLIEQFLVLFSKGLNQMSRQRTCVAMVCAGRNCRWA